MKLSLCTLILALMVSNVFAQRGNNYIKLSHNMTTETKAITGFDKLDVSEDFEVYIRFSDKEEKVVIEANENLHNLIQVENKGGTLKIYTKSYSTSYSSNRNDAEEKLVAYITAKTLTEIKGDEDVVIKLEDKLSADNLTIDLDEDCTLEGHIDVKNLSVKLNEDSELDIEGRAQTMQIKANEDCSINSFDFIVGDLAIDLCEESEVKLTVNGKINLKAREESTFTYKGDGSFTSKRLSGDSEVVKR